MEKTENGTGLPGTALEWFRCDRWGELDEAVRDRLDEGCGLPVHELQARVYGEVVAWILWVTRMAG